MPWTVDQHNPAETHTALACLQGKATLYVIVEVHVPLPLVPQLKRIEARSADTELTYRALSTGHNKRCEDTLLVAAFESPPAGTEHIDVTVEFEDVPAFSTRIVRA